MMSRLLFIIIAAAMLFSGQQYLVLPGTSVGEPLVAFMLTLILSPWLLRQFD